MIDAVGRIVRARSGFYDVSIDSLTEIRCRGSGKLRHRSDAPLVGDSVRISYASDLTGAITEILPRRNEFVRPSVANIDLMVIIVSNAIPKIDVFLLDRMITSVMRRNCEIVICVNKIDLASAGNLPEVYGAAGCKVLCTSAETGEGVAELRREIEGKVCALCGNSGVGKSSILKALDPNVSQEIAEVSEKLGRGRHTTRHVELFPLGNATYLADTPGFSAFDNEAMELPPPEEVMFAFREFQPYLGQCRFRDCLHVNDKDCAVRRAVEEGRIEKFRYTSYCALVSEAKKAKPW